MVKKYSSTHPDPIDKQVGANIRKLRTLQGISQEKMAEKLGITFQQVQKYENGSNRVGSSRLYNISQILRTSVGNLFEGVEGRSTHLKAAEETEGFEEDIFSKRETITLIRNYYSIEDEDVRKKLQDMIKSFADNN
jgi:transcriptional regulator with XRE-family HTH domain